MKFKFVYLNLNLYSLTFKHRKALIGNSLFNKYGRFIFVEPTIIYDHYERNLYAKVKPIVTDPV